MHTNAAVTVDYNMTCKSMFLCIVS